MDRVDELEIHSPMRIELHTSRGNTADILVNRAMARLRANQETIVHRHGAHSDGAYTHSLCEMYVLDFDNDIRYRKYRQTIVQFPGVDLVKHDNKPHIWLPVPGSIESMIDIVSARH